MTSATLETSAPRREASRRMSNLLALILVVLAVLPIVIFATDATNRGPLLRAGHAGRAVAERRARVAPEDAAARLERRRESRAARHPTLVSVLFGTAVQIFWITAAGVIGRRLFKLRL